jgi:cellulose biosynthesis protein BcsQ
MRIAARRPDRPARFLTTNLFAADQYFLIPFRPAPKDMRRLAQAGEAYEKSGRSWRKLSALPGARES